jgi:hypothetical protein
MIAELLKSILVFEMHQSERTERQCEGRRGKPYVIRHGEHNGDSIRNAIQEKIHKFTSASSSNETLQVSRIYDPNRSRCVVYILGILFCIFHEPARQARSLYLPQQRFDARLGSAQGSPT